MRIQIEWDRDSNRVKARITAMRLSALYNDLFSDTVSPDAPEYRKLFPPFDVTKRRKTALRLQDVAETSIEVIEALSLACLDSDDEISQRSRIAWSNHVRLAAETNSIPVTIKERNITGRLSSKTETDTWTGTLELNTQYPSVDAAVRDVREAFLMALDSQLLLTNQRYRRHSHRPKTPPSLEHDLIPADLLDTRVKFSQVRDEYFEKFKEWLGNLAGRELESRAERQALVDAVNALRHEVGAVVGIEHPETGEVENAFIGMTRGSFQVRKTDSSRAQLYCETSFPKLIASKKDSAALRRIEA